MAARLRARHQDEIRQKIKTSQLINRLQDHALGQGANAQDELSQTQLKAIEILLRKSMADLSQVEHSGDPENPITVAQVEFVRPVSDSTVSNDKTTDTDPGEA